MTSFDGITSAGHAGNFQFLGQWIYDAGEIKYVPWQGDMPCQGPSCQAKQKQPVTTGLPINMNVRSISLLSAVAEQQFDASGPLVAIIALNNFSAFSGYPHEREYPP